MFLCYLTLKVYDIMNLLLILIIRFYIRLADLLYGSVQFSCSVISDSATPWTAACQSSLSITNQLPEFIQTHVHEVSDAFQPSHPLSSPSPTFNLSQHRVFSNESDLHIRWPKYWSFSFSISPSNDYSGLISLKMDWLDLFAVQGTLKSLFQHHIQKHQFFSARLYTLTLTSIHDYWKNHSFD